MTTNSTATESPTDYVRSVIDNYNQRAEGRVGITPAALYKGRALRTGAAGLRLLERSDRLDVETVDFLSVDVPNDFKTGSGRRQLSPELTARIAKAEKTANERNAKRLLTELETTEHPATLLTTTAEAMRRELTEQFAKSGKPYDYDSEYVLRDQPLQNRINQAAARANGDYWDTKRQTDPACAPTFGNFALNNIVRPAGAIVAYLATGVWGGIAVGAAAGMAVYNAVEKITGSSNFAFLPAGAVGLPVAGVGALCGAVVGGSAGCLSAIDSLVEDTWHLARSKLLGRAEPLGQCKIDRALLGPRGEGPSRRMGALGSFAPSF